MRVVVGVGLLLLCPGLIGCSLFRQKRASDSANRGGDAPSGSKPFQGLPTARPEKTDAVAANANPPPNPDRELEGVLAGYIIDRFNKPVNGVAIRVIDLGDREDKGKLEIVLPKEQSDFYIPRLKPTHNYQLIARVKDGSRLLAGYRQATPPNPRIVITVSEDVVSPDTPPPPGPITLPGQTPTGPEKAKPSRGGAELGAPIKTTPDGRPDPLTSPGSYGIVPVRPGDPLDPSHIATGTDDEFDRVPPRPRQETINVPGPGAFLPPPPQFPADGGQRLPTEPRPATPAADGPRGAVTVPVGIPARTTSVPSCLLVGNKLENFALSDLDGNPWEYRKERRAKLLLLHFWPSAEAEFLPALNDLRDLQTQYDRDGLQVVGIAYEKGDFDTQVTDVRQARIRYDVNYVTLLGGGDNCPVRQQFQVERLPELVLVGADGQVIWRSRGAPNKDRIDELKLVISRQLGSPRP